ncbi:hypothetical protein OC842_007489 [Tilletia horrida]|uniref:Enoyl-CoA hydratase n=1 Tax=Tilletia horrida TaxID=155126 RepID=A0AAN6G666_9BASI|nr:hypothetical protein OC842_007489 [Tilletia horrida]
MLARTLRLSQARACRTALLQPALSLSQFALPDPHPRRLDLNLPTALAQRHQRRLLSSSSASSLSLSASSRAGTGSVEKKEEGEGTPYDPSRLVFLSRPSPSSEGGEDADADADADEGIVVLNLNRPQAANAISTTLLAQLHEALAHLRFPPSTQEEPAPALRTLIIRSLSPRIFCAGADLKERATMSIPQVDAFLLSLRTACSAIERLPCPVLAALDGSAMGGGLELALCADLRVAAAAAASPSSSAGAGAGAGAGASKTRFGLTEAKLGIIPGAGGTQRLSRLLGPAKAKDLIFSGRLLSPEQAFEVGLVDHLAPPSYSQAQGGAKAEETGAGTAAFGKALELAREMSQNGPLALRAAKLAIDKGSQMDIETALDFERECYERLFGTEDRLEGLRAFKEKRKPKYIGR